jgi:dynein heavy chain
VTAAETAKETLLDPDLPKTGDEAVEFFGRTGEDSEVKVIFLNRAPQHLIFRPYDLVTVDRTEIDPEHFTMSASGVVHIQPNQPSQFTPLGQWWRRSSLFNTLRSIPFFKNFLKAKTSQLWHQNVRFRKYSQIRKKLIKKLFLAKRAFCSTLLELNKQCYDLRSTRLIEYRPSQTYMIEDFIEHQNKTRTNTFKEFEGIIDKIQALLEKVCEDVTSRVRASEDGLPPGGLEEAAALTTHKSQKSKSMQQIKQEAIDRARALALARQEVAMLAQLIQLADYMVVESLLLLVVQQTDLFFQDLRTPSKKYGFFNINIGMERDTITFTPESNDMSIHLSNMTDQMVSCVHSVPRLLYMAAFKPHFDDKQKIEGPNLRKMLLDSAVFKILCSKIDEVVKSNFNDTRDYAHRQFEQYYNIFNYADDFDKEAFANQDHIANSRSIKREMLKLRAYGEQLDKMKLNNVVGIYGVTSKDLREDLTRRKKNVLEDMKDVLHSAAQDGCVTVLGDFQARMKTLQKKPTDLKSFAAYVESKTEISDEVKTLIAKSSTVDDMYKLLGTFEVKLSAQEQVKLDDLHAIHNDFQDSIDMAESDVSTHLGKHAQTLTQEIQRIDQDLIDIMTDLASGSATDPKAQTTEVLAMLNDVKSSIDAIEQKAQTYTHYQKLFSMTPHEYNNLESTRKLFEDKHVLWAAMGKWQETIDETTGWMGQRWHDLKAEDMEREVQATLKTAVVFYKQREDDVSLRFKEEMVKWKEYMNTLVPLGNEALRQRHWDQIFAKLQRPYDKDMTLNMLIQWQVMSIKDFAEEISGVASGEYALELQLEKIEAGWKNFNFTLNSYRDSKDIFILAGLDEVLTLLEDNQAGLQTMLASRFVMGIRDRVESWDRKLSRLSETLDEWLAVQRAWMYLESIFGAPDIQKQLPQETVQFLRVDQSWKDIMRKTKKRPHIVDAATAAGVLEMFQEANKTLEKIQKSLEDYLETKRNGFPRFYFLSNDELLEILSQTRDPMAVQPHLRKCFDAMVGADFEDGPALEEDGDPVKLLVAMNSSEKEKVRFSAPVPTAPKSVEFWMCDLENMMRQSLLDWTIKAREAYSEDTREEWFFQFPAASISTIDQVEWTRNGESAISSINDGTNPDGLKDFLDFSIVQINKMVGVIRMDLTNIQRSVMANLIVIDVHARDVTKRLIADKVTALSDFAWICQLRYYWDEESVDDQHGVIVRQTNAWFYYAWEYLGVVARLVITPLTDKCFMTLTGALNLLLGGAPAGPAGTGKTESVKDLGKALAYPVVVFNCSDGLDYKMMEKFFSGLAQAGAWACFDEFNRIDIEVLSVIAQQIMTICDALKEFKERFDFFGKEIRLNRNYGCFITMNPGYAGRTELPDNLKALFRPMAMMVPDYALIAEIMLFSEGFGDSLTLARKQTAMYRLASEQLSSQDHYDFGMRAVKSVLVMAGKLKRADPNMVEDVTLIRALRDSNIPKFLAPDIPLFEAILRDLFPGVVVPAIDYGTVKEYIEKKLVEHHLQVVQPFVKKIIQLHETMVVRHGVMLVGVTAVGKTTVSFTLGKAFTQMKQDGAAGGFEKVDQYTLNPKSITMGELYGEFNLLTQEWTDGIISTIVREACNSVATGDNNKKWIWCDGPVDAIWIESMNTVLDDNKTLCLNNGERIKLPATMTMGFEVNDLAVASPATVSRCGMVYLEPVYLGWRPYAKSWADYVMNERFPGAGDTIMTHMDNVVDKALAHVRKECKEHIVSVDFNLVCSFCSLMDSLIREEYGVNVGNLDTMLNKYFVFALIWTIGGNLQDGSLKHFEEYARTVIPEIVLDFPFDHSVWDFMVDPTSGNWTLWQDLVPEFHYDPNAPFFNLIVPTVDSTRIKYVLKAQVDGGFHVLLGGNSGVGKTVIVQDYLNHAGEKYVYQTKVFSAQTSARALQGFFEEKMEKIRKNLLGPPSGKQFLFLIDDMNMPLKETYGAQPPIELIRQIINVKDENNGGMYDLKKIGLFKKIQKTTFLAANAPPGGGRSEVTPRLIRHFHLLNLPDLSEKSMKTIFLSIITGFLTAFPGEYSAIGESMVNATLDIYSSIQKALLPTPTKSHYTFNLRDLAKVIQGILMSEPKYIADVDTMLRLWCHEAFRVFRDRLINEEDQGWFDQKMVEVISKEFDRAWSPNDFQDVCFGDFLATKPAPYIEITDWEKANKVLVDFAEDYTLNLNKPMDLVFFKDAIQHIGRISRLLRQPRGNALLVGVGGSGRQSLSKLSAFIADMKCFQIELARGYGVNEFHEDLKKLLMQAGAENKPTVFLFNDTQIIKESFLEDINNILNAGEVPDLFAADEMGKIIEAVRPLAKAAGKLETRDMIYAHFVQLCRENLHVVLTFSPVGDAFRNRLRMFPSLVNCCTIDWFMPWPKDALKSVALQFLAKVELGSEEMKDKIAEVCMTIHSSVREASEKFLVQLRRNTYTTPTSYLELINLYTSMLGVERDINNGKVDRYQNGVDKLLSTNAVVSDLQEEIIKLQPVLKQAGIDTTELIAVVTKDKEAAAIVQANVEVEVAKVNEATKEAEAIGADAQKDLDEALPAFHSAVKALDALNKSDIQEMKSFANPPQMVQFTMEAVCVLMGEKLDWKEGSVKLLNKSDFLQSLGTYDKDNIPEAKIKKLQKYINNPEFLPELVAKKSNAAKSLCMWVRAMDVYARVAKNVEPKKAALKKAQDDVAAMNQALATKNKELAEVLARVKELEDKLEATLKKRDELQAQSDISTARLGRAEQLTGGLASEKVRWEASLKQLNQDKIDLTGNILLSAGTIAYTGPFTFAFRRDMINIWVETCQSMQIPVDPAFTLERIIGDPPTIRNWNIQGLPADPLSIENGIIVTKGRRWPLMIDPQTQAVRWIRQMEKANRVQVIKLTESTYLRTLENCIRVGNPVLLENVEETLDPALEPVLTKAVFKQSGRLLIRLGETDVDYNTDFRFYITSKLPNPHYSPEICVKVTVVNFTVTLQGLEDQLLVLVVAHERPELEEEKNELVVKIADGQKQLKDIEDKILYMLANSQGNILDDEVLIATLGASKTASKEINEQLAQAEETKQRIESACEGYRPVAKRGSILYFVVATIGQVDPMYQYSLQFFTQLFNNCMDKSTKSENLEERVQIIINVVTEDVYTNVCRGLFEKDKKMFSFMIAVQIMMQELKTISAEQWNFFLTKGGFVAPEKMPPNPAEDWLKPDMLGGLMNLQELKGFGGLLDSFDTDTAGWKKWFDCTAPHETPLPGKWESELTLFQRLLVTRVLRDEKVVDAVTIFILKNIGKHFIDVPAFDLAASFKDSTPLVPMIFVLSTGADPTMYLYNLAKDLGVFERLKMISLGQGQGPIAEALISSARESGDWVCLQNCHLASSWMPELEKILETHQSMKLNDDFRLWLSSMPSKIFPASILQVGIKLTNEPPKGLRANLKRTYEDMTESEYDYFDEKVAEFPEMGSKVRPWKKMLFGLCFFHAAIQERRKYGPIGWNIRYEWNQSDLLTAMANLRMYIEEQPHVPYETLQYVVGDVNYGGRVTDYMDQRTVAAILIKYICTDAVEDNTYQYTVDGKYAPPAAGSMKDCKEYIDNLPLTDSPEVFGLHRNAAIAFENSETKYLLDTIISSQPRTGGGGGGMSVDEIVANLAHELASKLPSLLTDEKAAPVTFSTDDEGTLNSLGTFLLIEMGKFNKMLKKIKATLAELQRAIKGLVVMSSELDEMFTALQFQKVPPSWGKVSYLSLKPLGSWYKDLIERIEFMDNWITQGPPDSFWMSAFFFPQGYMTAALQTYAREKTIAIDTLDFRTEVTKMTKEDVSGGPAQGVYIYGAYMEGARFDVNLGHVVESNFGETHVYMPVIWLDPITKDANFGKTPGMYNIPFYKVSSRAGTLSTTGHSTNFIRLLEVPTGDQPVAHWIRRSVALLTQLDD